jgi:hypothetical protein
VFKIEQLQEALGFLIFAQALNANHRIKQHLVEPFVAPHIQIASQNLVKLVKKPYLGGLNLIKIE